MKKEIPIFPLNLVMFPDALYPLHIFEERYKRMIQRCLTNNEFFGIVSKIELDISKIGCTVKVSTVLKTYDTGSMDIIVKGYTRFILESSTMHNDGYLIGIIEPFEDEKLQQDNDILFFKTVKIFRKILSRTSLQLSKSFWDSLQYAPDKSYKLAEKSGLNLRQQQDILSLQSESDRLNYLYKHLVKLENTLEKSEILKELISGDGYIQG